MHQPAAEPGQCSTRCPLRVRSRRPIADHASHRKSQGHELEQLRRRREADERTRPPCSANPAASDSRESAKPAHKGPGDQLYHWQLAASGNVRMQTRRAMANANPVSSRSCSRLSRAEGDPLHGTASAARRWILLEEPGTGGCDAVLEQRVPVDVAARLKEVSRQLRARIVLIRRHGRYTPQGRRCYVVSSAPAASWAEYHTLESSHEILDIDWAPLARDNSVGGRPLPHALYLVCTNGRHDPCCAELGRPVANALQPDHGERVWESSHLGGDRFAANMVLLPEGLYFGRVEPANASDIVTTYECGRIHLEHYRGRTGFPAAAQTAEHHVRVAYGIDGIDDLRFTGMALTAPTGSA